MTTPENAFWYHLSYIITVTIYSGYVVSLWMRRRALRKQANDPAAR